MLIDSHAHLNMAQFDDDLDDVLRRAAEAGVGEILNIGYGEESLGETIELTERYAPVYGALGIHPHNAKDWSDDLEETIKRLLLRRKIMAVGEIGLDYYRDLSPRDAQRDVFRRQIGIALYFAKPIVVHCREAFDDVMKIIEQEGAGETGGVFHAFPGGYEEAVRVIESGFAVGIGGPLTYKNSKLPEVVSRLPSGSILLETDCPYLPPVPYRGKRNEPAYVRIVAEKLADVLGVRLADIERASESNYRRIFHREYGTAPSIAYAIKKGLYLNVTATCTNDCMFCPRPGAGRYLYGYNLNLENDPSSDELVSAARTALEFEGCEEIVFCGYGEPTTRLETIVDAARGLRTAGLPIRLNTNGQGNLIHCRNIVPELEAVFDAVSVSLNAPDGDTYLWLCRPDAGEKAFDSVMDFIRKAADSKMGCTVTAIEYPSIDVEACRRLVETISGASFRVRKYHVTACEE
jgi:TatD DNase family protein